MPRPEYDFNHPIFKTKRNWLLYAKEHMDLWDLRENSDVIGWEVKSTVGPLEIPSVYHITYNLRSITAIDEEAQPIYGNQHVMELTIPTRYPLEPASIFMRTDVWHPNIQSAGRFKGKICGNVSDYGVDYSLRQLVLRVGEILQYKNYLADFVAPYPEDPKVAEWVKAYGEPRDIVNRKKGIVTDEQPLLRPVRSEQAKPPALKIKTDNSGPPSTEGKDEAESGPSEKETPKIRIGKRVGGGENERKSIRLGGKRVEKDEE
ncbi:MAG: ubiquitin-conjugating enzyme E2 [Bacteroidota bacterium]